MALAHRSIATINSPEFINLQPFDINPLMSSCDIKVFYLGENRNGSFISKDVAAEMAKTLRGAPIVGYYKKDKQDFADHGQQMVWDDTGIHFNCLTKPYGFVSPVAKVWFQDFQDQDDFGNSIVRTYLMTTGFLWTGQFEEAQQVLQDEGKPHSMELDEKSLQGQWSKNIKKDMDFFIINDAVISKLCILGDDVQPCYEGSSIAPSQVNTSFTLDNKFKQTLFKMMQQLTEALEGGTMANTKEKNLLNEKVEEDVTDINTPDEDPSVTFEKKDKEEKEDKQQTTEDTEENGGANDNGNKEEDKEKDKKDKYSLLEQRFEQLQLKYDSLESELTQLREFKLNAENQEKDNLINEFYMLSNEDKKDVIENKTKYTLDEIKSKLAVICFEKKVNFNLEDSSEKDNVQKKVVTTFNVESKEDSTPDWIKAVEQTMNNKF